MLYIDINPPTVSAKATESEEIKEDTDSTFDVYFNISENGKAPITSEVYTDTSNSNQVVTNTSELAVGEHIIKCTVTKENGLTASAEKTIVVTSAMPEVTFRASNDSYEDSYGIGYEKTGSWIDIPEDVEIDYNETVWMIRNHGTIITSETEWTEVYNETNYGSGAADVLDSPVFAYAIDGEQTPYCNVHLKLVDTSGNIYYFMSDFTVNTTVTLPDSDTYIGALSGMVIPEGVIAVKIVSDCADSWIPPDPDGYVVCDYCGEYVCGSDTEYFSVTPGATYSLSQEGVGWTSRVYFSSSINSRSPYATLDCPE